MYENYVHPEDIEDLKDRLLIAQRTHDGIEAEARMRGRDGKYRWFLHHLFPFVDGEGKILYWCGTRIDIDDRKRAADTAHRENLVLREEVDRVSMFEEIVGTSVKLQPVLARVSKVAPTDSTVLITGETGTGKELIARAIHKRSRRANHAFVSVNCAALPKDLVPSELFGHEKGAFTGALQRRLGRFELAEGGTIFLDEIGELPPETQVALLRVLQEREFERVGGNQTIRTNARVIAATHQDLPAAIERGTFRSDLYYRINIFPIEIPSLRERSDDIRLLVEYFVERFSSKAGKKIRRIDGKSLAQLQAYSWPGNIRELQNIIERSVILCENDVFLIDESWLSNRLETKRSLPTEVINREREMIEEALAQTKGRVSGPSGAAAKLGMPPSTLDSKIKSLGIDKRSFHHP
jgi:transcriptional regulator with GAF, ATPase, and Fis domain